MPISLDSVRLEEVEETKVGHFSIVIYGDAPLLTEEYQMDEIPSGPLCSSFDIPKKFKSDVETIEAKGVLGFKFKIAKKLMVKRKNTRFEFKK